jgi:tRNA threonylcarbamoyladenosine biosynthesis protein TsaB
VAENQPLILSIETSTNTCSTSIHKGEKLLGFQELHIQQSHSKVLSLMIRDLLNYCGIHLNEVDAVAISEGPGSYTGLRIGASTAKGLCYGMEKPLIAINTLEAMAYRVIANLVSPAVLCPMIDARRMEVYCLIMDQKGQIIQPTAAKIVEKDCFKDLLSSQDVIFFGDGAAKCEGILGNNEHAKFIHGILPSAVGIGQLAYKKFALEEFVDIAYFEPFYLKEFKAGKPRQLI